MISAAFGMQMQEVADLSVAARQHLEFKPVGHKIPIFSDYGNYVFDKLQYYIRRQGSVCIQGAAQSMCYFIIQQLAVINKWKMFHIISFEDYQ